MASRCSVSSMPLRRSSARWTTPSVLSRRRSREQTVDGKLYTLATRLSREIGERRGCAHARGVRPPQPFDGYVNKALRMRVHVQRGNLEHDMDGPIEKKIGRALASLSVDARAIILLDHEGFTEDPRARRSGLLFERRRDVDQHGVLPAHGEPRAARHFHVRRRASAQPTRRSSAT